MRSSSLQLGMICPGSVALALQVPAEEKARQFATSKGSIGHTFLERCIKQGRASGLAYLEEELVQGKPLIDATFRLDCLEFWKWWNEANLVPAVRSRPGVRMLTEYLFRTPMGGDTLSGKVDLAEVMGKRGWVVDWKFYGRTDWLPPIERDVQMYSYAVALKAKFPELEAVTVLRVLCYQCQADAMRLDLDGLEEAAETIAGIMGEIAANRDEYVIGSQCQHCLLTPRCPAFRRQVTSIKTEAMGPYQGGDFATEAEALRFLLAAPAVEALLAEGKAAVQRWVEDQGRPVRDLVSGQEYAPRTMRGKRYVANAAAAIETLRESVGGGELGDQVVEAATSTTISAIERALQALGIPRAQRWGFIRDLEDEGYILREGERKDWRWRPIEGLAALTESNDDG